MNQDLTARRFAATGDELSTHSDEKQQLCYSKFISLHSKTQFGDDACILSYLTCLKGFYCFLCGLVDGAKATEASCSICGTIVGPQLSADNCSRCKSRCDIYIHQLFLGILVQCVLYKINNRNSIMISLSIKGIFLFGLFGF